MTQLYYTAPIDEEFDELKEKSMELWNEIADHPGYLEEKLSRIRDIKNVGDNFMYMVAMFDQGNQWLLANKLSEPTRNSVRERMIDGGTPEALIVF